MVTGVDPALPTRRTTFARIDTTAQDSSDRPTEGSAQVRFRAGGESPSSPDRVAAGPMAADNRADAEPAGSQLYGCPARRTVPAATGNRRSAARGHHVDGAAAAYRQVDTSTCRPPVTSRNSPEGLAHPSNVDTYNFFSRRHPVTTWPGRCAEAHLGCPCRGDRTLHEERAKEISEARSHSQESVDCPECGASTTPLNIVNWGHCRACRTAQSREMYPLRW